MYTRDYKVALIQNKRKERFELYTKKKWILLFQESGLLLSHVGVASITSKSEEGAF